MQAKELRRKLHEVLDRADDGLIRARLRQIVKGTGPGNEEITLDDVFAVIEEVVHGRRAEIIAHTAQGKPLTAEDFVAHIWAAEEELERGEIITFEDLKKDAENW